MNIRIFFLILSLIVSCIIRTPSVESLKKAMQTYARQGGTSTIFINDDGMQVHFVLFCSVTFALSVASYFIYLLFYPIAFSHQ